MSLEREFRDVIGGFRAVPSVFRLGSVVSYDEKSETIAVKDHVLDIVYYDIPLKVVINDDAQKVVLIPKIGSLVSIGVANERIVLLGYATIERVKGRMGTLAFDISDDGLEVKRGTESLHAILRDLATEVLVSMAAIKVVLGVPLNTAKYTLLKERFGKIFK